MHSSGDTGLISQNLDAPRVKLNSSHTSKKGQMNHSKEISLSSEKKNDLQWPAKVADTPQTHTDDSSLSLSSSNTQNKLVTRTEI